MQEQLSGALSSRVAVVTGASSGIGRASVAALRAAGASVAALDLRPDPESAGDVPFVACDVTDEQSVAAAFDEVDRTLGEVSIAHANAGIALIGGDGPDQDGPAERLALDVWHRTLAVNTTGSFLIAKHAIPRMRRAGHGSLVFTASIGGAVIGTPNTAYATSKAAVTGLTRALAVQYGPEGIRSNAILPGPVRTPMSMMARAEPEEYERWLSGIPLRRIGEPSDIGEVVAFLASDAAAFLNGALVRVDGGMTIL